MNGHERLQPPPPDRSDAYFFDVDGTLSEISDAPADARVDPALAESLAVLRTAAGGALALVSGRTIAELDALFPGTRYAAAGQHGTERRAADGVLTRHPFAAARMEQLRDRITDSIGGRRGVALEDKGDSLALHYRHAPQFASFVHGVARRRAAEYGPEIAVQQGKFVIELLPAGQNKGGAVVAFLDEEPFRGRRPVFVGDDITDESAFATVNRMGGVSVKVGSGRSVARWRLAGVYEVRAWIESAR